MIKLTTKKRKDFRQEIACNSDRFYTNTGL